MRVAGEPRFERAVEIGPANARQLVVKFDRNAARLDDRAQLAADVHEVRIDVAVARAFAWPGERLAAQDPGGVPIEDEAAAEPFRLAPAQPQAVRHARAREPVMAHQAHPIELIDRIGTDPEEAAGQLLRDVADHLQVEGGDLAPEGRKVSSDIRRAGAVRRGDCSVVGFMIISFC